MAKLLIVDFSNVVFLKKKKKTVLIGQTYDVNFRCMMGSDTADYEDWILRWVSFFTEKN